MLIATPIILENYIDWVIMRKKVFFRIFRENTEWKITDEEIIKKNEKNILGDFWEFIIIDRKFYDISKLRWEYF